MDEHIIIHKDSMQDLRKLFDALENLRDHVETNETLVIWTEDDNTFTMSYDLDFARHRK